VRAVGREEIERIDLSEARRVEVALQDLAVHERDDNLLVRRGWGTKLQSIRFWRSYLRQAGPLPFCPFELRLIVSRKGKFKRRELNHAADVSFGLNSGASCRSGD
jgi:hypothetical protein